MYARTMIAGVSSIEMFRDKSECGTFETIDIHLQDHDGNTIGAVTICSSGVKFEAITTEGLGESNDK